MFDDIQYHVTFRDEEWKGTVEGGSRASVTGSTKEDVVKETIQLAKNSRNSQVIIHKKDGVFQEERTYGNDPFPPRG